MQIEQKKEPRVPWRDREDGWGDDVDDGVCAQAYVL